MAFKITWMGHAAFAIDADGEKILIDPFISDNPAAEADPRNLEADYILISHGHGDHVGDAVSIAKRTGATVITNAELSRWFKKQGIKDTHAQHVGGGYTYPFGYLKFTIAEHGSGLPDGSTGGNPVGFLITTGSGKKVYFACDTGLFYTMKLYDEEGIDLAFLPIGDNYTMGPDDALRAVKLLEPEVVIPVHYNTWELIEQDPVAWAERVNAGTDTEPVVLKPGETYIVD